jgi:hypothetical protein
MKELVSWGNPEGLRDKHRRNSIGVYKVHLVIFFLPVVGAAGALPHRVFRPLIVSLPEQVRENMDDAEKREELRKRLNEIHKWPSIFMFKFILPRDEQKITQLKRIFDERVEIQERLSANGRYIGITVREMMLDAESIFQRYEAASRIEGIISL